MREPYGLPSEEVFTRKVTGPNGIDYLVALPGWYWNSLDWINDNGDWREADFFDVAWRLAREVEDTQDIGGVGGFQGVLERSLQGLIWVKMDKTIKQSQGIANSSLDTKE
jgi:hypothetical protein